MQNKQNDQSKITNLMNNSSNPSFNLGLSLRKFSEKLMNVIDLNNKVLKVKIKRIKLFGLILKKWNQKKRILLKILKS